MSQIPPHHQQKSKNTLVASSSRPNKVPRPGWPEIIVGFVVLAIESIQREIVNQVRAAVLENIGLDSRMAALISLMKTAHFTNAMFTSEERSKARLRIKAIAKGELVGKAVFDTIANAQAAMMAAINASISASASSSSSNQ